MKAYISKRPNYITSRQAADYLGVTISTIRKWDASGALQPAWVTPTGHRRYTQSQLDELIARPRPILEARGSLPETQAAV